MNEKLNIQREKFFDNQMKIEEPLEQVVERIVKMDEIILGNDNSPNSAEQQEAMKKFEDSFAENDGGKCTVGILWKTGEPSIIDNRQEAIPLFHLRERMDKDKEKQKGLNEAVIQWEENDFITEVFPGE